MKHLINRYDTFELLLSLTKKIMYIFTFKKEDKFSYIGERIYGFYDVEARISDIFNKIIFSAFSIEQLEIRNMYFINWIRIEV